MSNHEITIRVEGVGEFTAHEIGIDTSGCETPYILCKPQGWPRRNVRTGKQLADFFRYDRQVRLDIGEGRVLQQIMHIKEEPDQFVLVSRPLVSQATE